MPSTDNSARLCGLEYHNLSRNCLFALCFHITTLLLSRSHRVMNWRKLGLKLSWGNLETTATFLTKHDGKYARTASDLGKILNGDFTNKKRGPSCRSPNLYTEGYLSKSHLLNTELLQSLTPYLETGTRSCCHLKRHGRTPIPPNYRHLQDPS